MNVNEIFCSNVSNIGEFEKFNGRMTFSFVFFSCIHISIPDSTIANHNEDPFMKAPLFPWDH